MAQFIDITRVVVGTEYLTATVHIAEEAPLMTSEDLEGTTRVYNLLPTIIDHACMGDRGETFKDCMGNTELAHLLEHVTIELLARTNLTDEVISGRTWRELAYDRTYSIQLPCVDDVLVTAALSSGAWLMQWAFSGGAGPVPDVDAIVGGLVQLLQSLADGSQPAAYGEADDAGYDDYANDEGEYYDDEEDLGRGPSMSRKIL